MPHDYNGDILNVGDEVMVPCVVDSITMSEEYCNVTLKTKLFMPPKDYPETIVLNTKQTYKVQNSEENTNG